MQCRWRGVLLGIASVCFGSAAPPPAASAPFFTGLGDLPGGAFQSQANDVSIDGGVVVGTSKGANGDEAFVWTAGTGIFSLGEGTALAVSAGGAVVAGRGFRWNASEGRVDLPRRPFPLSGFSFGNDVSADGTVIVGTDTLPPFGENAARWTAGGGFGYEAVVLPPEAGSFTAFASLNGVSADGSLSVLNTSGELGIPRESFRLHADGASDQIGVIADEVSAEGISPDGSLVVGNFFDASGREAFLWTGALGLVSLGDLPGGAVAGFARAVAPNKTVVGQGTTDQGLEAFVWDPILGLRNLRDDLIGRGVDLTGWTLTDATGISFDGQTIVGTGVDPDGNHEGWLVALPEPGTAALVALGLGTLSAQRRRWVAGQPR